MGPLDDLRVIELGTLIAGPFCGQLLGDMGADVIKVEPPGIGDPMRSWGRGLAVWWPIIGRNKRCITLNLREELGQEIFNMFLAVASGDKSKSELQGLGDYEFVPWQIGAVM